MMKPLKIVLCLFMVLFYTVSQAEFRDPTQPVMIRDKANGNDRNPLVLNGVLISPFRRLAIINGTIVKLGDEVQNAHVITIESNYVILDNTGEKIFLYLVDPPIKHILKTNN